jgi:hypothetical protein
VLVMFQNAFQKLTINRHAGQNEAAARKAYLSLSDPARTGDGSVSARRVTGIVTFPVENFQP